MNLFNNVIARQIGRMNVLAISGGRTLVANDDLLVLPVSYGYQVRVELDRGSDTYNVTRAFKRSGKVTDKGTVTGVYADQLGEVAYQASCFRNVEFGS